MASLTGVLTILKDNQFMFNDDGVLPGPRLDGGAPNLGLARRELELLEAYTGIRSTALEPIPKPLKSHTHWQYGSFQLASKRKRVITSIFLKTISHNDQEIIIFHLVFKGSSQYVIGTNMKSKCNIMHMNRNAIDFDVNGQVDSIALANHQILTYFPCIFLSSVKDLK